MKKYICILIFWSIIVISAFYINYYKDSSMQNKENLNIKFSKSNDIIARIILYKYVLSEFKMNPKQVYDFANINFNKINALRIDLDDDRKYEIIGVVHSSYYSCTEGSKLFILKKNNNKYQDISDIYFIPNNDFIVLKTKKNGAYILKTSAYSNKCRLKNIFREIPIYIHYKNNKYTYDYQKMDISNPHFNCSED